MKNPSPPPAPFTQFHWSWRRFAISLGLILVLVGLYVVWQIFLDQSKPQPRFRVVGQTAYRVSSEVLSQSAQSETLRVNGLVQAARQVDLRPLAAGQVAWVNPALRDGGQISAGETLLRLVPDEYARSVAQAEIALLEVQERQTQLENDLARQRAQLVVSQEQLAIAEAELKRRQDLAAQGIISRATLDQVETQTLSQRNASTSAANALSQIEEQISALATSRRSAELGLAQAEDSLAKTELTAPFSGVVLTSLVQEGQLVSGGDLAARLLDSSALEVQFQLTQDQFAALSQAGTLLGSGAEISWSGQTQGQSLAATIDRQAGALNAGASGVPLYASLGEDAFAAGLRPGAFVDVALGGADFGDIYALPREAYFPDLRGGGIYLAEDRPVIFGAQWEGPTSKAGLSKVNTWLSDQALENPEGNLANALVPADVAGADEDTPLGELYTCIAFRIAEGGRNEQNQRGNAAGAGGGRGNGQRGGSRRGGGGGGAQGANTATSDVGPGTGRLARLSGLNSSERGRGNRPELSREQAQALCPRGRQSVAVATPVELVAFTNGLALIRAAEDHDLSGARAVTQRFDRLADGTWLTLVGQNSDQDRDQEQNTENSQDAQGERPRRKNRNRENGERQNGERQNGERRSQEAD